MPNKWAFSTFLNFHDFFKSVLSCIIHPIQIFEVQSLDLHNLYLDLLPH